MWGRPPSAVPSSAARRREQILAKAQETSITMTNPAQPATPSAPREAARFWEPGRLLYNAILFTIVLLWLILTWPHFRPSLTLGSFEAFFVLGLLANLAYSAAYLAEFCIHLLAPGAARRRARIALLVLGTLFAIVLENYWIADEIYPYANNPPPSLFAGAITMPTAIASNMNFPAPLAVLGFLAAIGGLVLAVAAALIFWFARITAIVTGAAAIIYLALLFSFSAASHETALAHGQEKYFCEIDCHLAYSVVDAHAQPDGHLVVTLRTRFDETTTSPNRPKDAPLTPSPREVRLLDSSGRQYAPISTTGTPLLTPLKPADSYTTQLEFNLPQDDATKDNAGLRLLINTVPQWPDKLV